MRLLLVMLCIALMGATAWHAVRMGTDENNFAGAPQIERKVDEGTRAAIGGVAGPEVTVETDGRNVTLAGLVAGETKRDEILAAAGETYLLGRLTDRMEVLETVSPFTFSVERAADGRLELAGHVPDRTSEDSVLAEARAIAGGADVQSDLILAAGAPEPAGGWAAIVGTGITALSAMEEGRFVLNDLDAKLTGRVSGKAAADVVDEVVARAPDAAWMVELEGADPPPPAYRFSAMKTADGSVILDGLAPDEETVKLLRMAASEVGSREAEGELEAAGVPADSAWSERVLKGLVALSRTESGLLLVSDMDLALTADVDTNDDLAALMSVTEPDWTTDITVLNPPPAADVTIELDEDGGLTAAGVLPKGLDAGSFATMLPGMDTSGLNTELVGGESDWSGAAQALNIVLPRLASAKAQIGETKLSITGALRRGFSADGSVAAVRTVMPDDWTLDLNLTESAPLSGMVFSKRGDEVVLSGVLPQGLSEEDALALVGENAGGEALASAGAGDAEIWRKVLAGLSEGLEPFSSATGEMTEGNLTVDGTLKPGYEPGEAQTWLSDKLATDWEVALSASETQASEGDARRNLATDENETFRSGYWLPDVDFAVSEESCKAEIDGALAREPIQFVTGSAEIDQKGRRLLNRLAAVAVRCLNSSVLRLEIAGHTDAQGNDQNNQILSERRAEAVRAALADRGVRSNAMTTRGFGETQPLASNNTAEGRAQNRRIEFVWSAESN